MQLLPKIYIVSVCLVTILSSTIVNSAAISSVKTEYRNVEVAGHNIFYREAGDKNKPTIVLLHGYPSSSHTYRELIPLLSDQYHIIAADYLGSGYSDKPDPEKFEYTFDVLAEKMTALLATLKIDKYTIYMQDFGAPVGFRMMMNDPDHIEAMIVQNANAYMEGLTPKRQQFFRQAHEDTSLEKQAQIKGYTSRDAIINGQYLRDVKKESHHLVSPDAWNHDLSFLQTDAQRNIQVELIQDYYNNLLAYPSWQKFMAEQQYPSMIIWGRHDAAFIVPGAVAYLLDLPHAELHLLDAGHFAVEEKPRDVARLVVNFMQDTFNE